MKSNKIKAQGKRQLDKIFTENIGLCNISSKKCNQVGKVQ